MHFPIERFRSLDYDSRAKAIMSWNHMKDRRAMATWYRKWSYRADAKMAYNSAILALFDVKYWAVKAKEIRE